MATFLHPRALTRLQKLPHGTNFPASSTLRISSVVARPGTTNDRALARTPELRTRTRLPGSHVAERGPTGLFLVEAHTRDISSTLIRQRLAARESIDDLVPSAVARHIATHHLYQVENDLHGTHTNTTVRKLVGAKKRAVSRAARLPKEVTGAVHAAQGKKASDVVVLDLRKAGGFTDYFVICTGGSGRQIQAIADAVKKR